MFKKTKIVCTMGPTTDKPGVIEELMKNGMNCARFNFSHGDHAEQLGRIEKVREAARHTDTIIPLLLDTKGPEMRLGSFKDGKVQLVKGNTFRLTQSDEPGDENGAPISYKNLYQEVKPGDTILLSDGLVGLKVKEIDGQDIVTEILNNGPMSTRKRVAVPGVAIGLPPISEQDEKDILFGIEHDMDFVAASFIQRASDVEAIRKLIKDNNGHMEIIAKIENLEGVKNIDAIIAAADGIMVARGDLGVEIPAEDVPVIQKDVIAKCNKAGKLVIVATQMLESMTSNPRPTRAEVSDVGNAVFDGTDAIMLSGETASGDYPVEAVQTMSTIAKRIEESIHYENRFITKGMEHKKSITDAVAHSTVQLAYELDATAIITPTETGFTTQMVSKYRPQATIIAYASTSKVARQLNLRWGVQLVNGRIWDDEPDRTGASIAAALRSGLVEKGDIAVVTSGINMSKGNNTNKIQIRTID
ncbi:MAG: pyruvate kinase [Anaerovibrio sp.]|uniref:pyruvate kinase n=1 Tax=Anaerovibrio sp. TaxID=1872532 RepID=UPI001B29C453|nr:pyruvate kinase [Anaerovibrio sp.]MBO5588732.1 pyruvate kinase [Anaerovibrio sp.]MBO6244712.1 pyruvate kinase [Anaerovibrio sp.]